MIAIKMAKPARLSQKKICETVAARAIERGSRRESGGRCSIDGAKKVKPVS